MPPGDEMRTLASFKNIHKGETFIVCGCGASLSEFRRPERIITIGVNDVGRRFHPNYLVVLDRRRQFNRNRFHYVENSKAEYLFTQLDLGRVKPDVVRFRLGRRGGTDFSNPHVLHYSQNSPYVALCLAVHMGAARIGLIGVDFTKNHFFGKTGSHNLSPHIAAVDRNYRFLGRALNRKGVEVLNLSNQSLLEAFPKIDIDTFFSTRVI
jgi:hypothetical protein